MMITEYAIRTLVEEKTQGTDQFIVSVKVLPNNRIRVFVDALGSLNVTDCAAIARHIEGSLDRDKEDFELEVSSPGLTASFEHPLQYKKHIGQMVKIVLNSGESVKGKLVQFNGKELVVESEKKLKNSRKHEIEPVMLPVEEIKEAKSLISFK